MVLVKNESQTKPDGKNIISIHLEDETINQAESQSTEIESGDISYELDDRDKSFLIEKLNIKNM